MKKITSKKVILLLGLVIALLTIGSSALASRQMASGNIIALLVTYRLDQRLTSGVHIGERWVSPPLYDIISEESAYTIEARVEGIATNGDRMVIGADLISNNPNLFTVMPGPGNTYAIHIRGKGATRLDLIAAGIYQPLYITAAYQTSQCTNLRVVVSQISQPTLPTVACLFWIPSLNR